MFELIHILAKDHCRTLVCVFMFSVRVRHTDFVFSCVLLCAVVLPLAGLACSNRQRSCLNKIRKKCLM